MAITKSRVVRRKDLSQNFKRRKIPDRLVPHAGSSSKVTLNPLNGMFVSSFSTKCSDINNLQLIHGNNDSGSSEEDSKRKRLSTPIESNNEKEAMVARAKMKADLDMFYDILSKQTKDESRRETNDALKAFRDAIRVLEQEKRFSFTKEIGSIFGVEIGDKFQNRAELRVVGLHCPLMSGIDYMKINGKNFATSVIASGRYDNDLTSFERLTYSGQGGNPSIGNKQPVDQRLEGGNLAIKNSKDMKYPIRVFCRFTIAKNSSHFGMSGEKLHNTMFVYLGLYHVESYKQERNKFCKLVFKFSLKRIDGQPNPTIFGKYPILSSKRGKTEIKRGVVLSNDISQGKEKDRIRSINDQDEEKLPHFDYITNVIYPDTFEAPLPPLGCESINGCEHNPHCVCMERNGGSMPYNSKGHIISTRPLIYECFPQSKCPSSCLNRVSQKGISFQLEVFKAESKRWGVRSRSYIPSGSFVCEFIGEVLRDEQVKERIGTYHQSGNVHILSYQLVEDSETLTIDATRRGNVGRFVNHNDYPNLCAKYVLYDHVDEKVPHMMLVAINNIPPRQELTIDCSYRMTKFGM